MMDFTPSRPRRRPAENIVPMINVVFLLLIFFLMSAQITPPEPFAVTPPTSSAEGETPEPDTLYVSASGEMSYEGASGDAALSALTRRGTDAPLSLRVDAGLPATTLAALLTKLSAAGVTSTQLVTGDQ